MMCSNHQKNCWILVLKSMHQVTIRTESSGERNACGIHGAEGREVIQNGSLSSPSAIHCRSENFGGQLPGLC